MGATYRLCADLDGGFAEQGFLDAGQHLGAVRFCEWQVVTLKLPWQCLGAETSGLGVRAETSGFGTFRNGFVSSETRAQGCGQVVAFLLLVHSLRS